MIPSRLAQHGENLANLRKRLSSRERGSSERRDEIPYTRCSTWMTIPRDISADIIHTSCKYDIFTLGYLRAYVAVRSSAMRRLLLHASAIARVTSSPGFISRSLQDRSVGKTFAKFGGPATTSP